MSIFTRFEMQRIGESLHKAYGRFLSRGYVLRELLLANLLMTPKLRLLLSDTPEVRPAFEKWFRYTGHRISFGAFLPEVLAAYDVLVPLNLDDLRRLDAMRHLTGHALLPIPSAAAIDLCDDKLLFNRFLISNGFTDVVPAMPDNPRPPYILKKRRSHRGECTHVILDPTQEEELLRDCSQQDYFRQELVQGRYEYATHVLFINNRIVRSLSIQYDMQQPAPVKGREQPKRQRIVRCAHLGTFSAILSAVQFDGLCCIDYKLADGKPMIMEVNPRFGGSLCPYFFSFLRDLPRGSRSAPPKPR